jgi:membrane protease YdiL (CAAX protease family)
MACGSSVAVIWFATQMARREFSEYLALNWPNRDEVMRALMITAILWMIEIVARSVGTPTTLVANSYPFKSVGELLVLFLAACVAAPIMEEFVFRGFVFRGWSESFLGPIAAIVLSSAIWGAIHTQYDWWGRSWVFVSGLALGYFRWRANSTWLAVIVHSVMNFFPFFSMRYT